MPRRIIKAKIASKAIKGTAKGVKGRKAKKAAAATEAETKAAEGNEEEGD